MADFSDPAKKRQDEIEELEDDLGRAQKKQRELKADLKKMQRKEELADAEIGEMEDQIDRLKRESERDRVMESIDKIDVASDASDSDGEGAY